MNFKNDFDVNFNKKNMKIRNYVKIMEITTNAIRVGRNDNGRIRHGVNGVIPI